MIYFLSLTPVFVCFCERKGARASGLTLPTGLKKKGCEEEAVHTLARSVRRLTFHIGGWGGESAAAPTGKLCMFLDALCVFACACL